MFAASANGDVAPKRTISGSNVSLSQPDQVFVAGSEIFVTTFSTDVQVFPINANGNVAPTRRLTGPATQLNRTAGLTVF